MTIRHLKIFIAVYDAKNITHAAKALHLTQPVVTRTIKELESYYNIHLFERMNHKLYITDEGHRLYAHARQIIDAFDLMERDVSGSSENFTLHIGTTFYLGSFLLPGVLTEFKKIYPKAKIKAQVFNAGNLQRALCESALDLALIEDQVTNTNLCSEAFFHDRLVLVLPWNHPLLEKDAICMEDLRDADFLVREKGSFGRLRFDASFANHGITIDPLLESCSTQAIIQGVRAGLGLALLPEHLVKNCIKCGLVASRMIIDESFDRQNYIVWHKNKLLTPHLVKMMEICRKVALELKENDIPCAYRAI